MLDKKTTRNVLNASYRTGRRAFYGEHELVLLRLDGNFTRYAGAEMQKPANLEAELRKVLAIGDTWNPDRVIVLTSNTDTIEKHIRQRNRPYESAENMVRRFRLIDGEFRRLAPGYPNTVVINRDHMEFHERAGLVAVIEAAGLPMFTEIPYEKLDRYDAR